jgi:prepilin-type N-terminal cleavage/methylation domain-containing protein
MKRAFTIIELSITIAVISVLIIVLFFIIKPQDFFKKNRDFQRITDIQLLNSAIDIFKQEEPTISLGEVGKIYVSLPDPTSTCPSWSSYLPPLPYGYQYACSSEPKNINGTGWIPVNFGLTSMAQLNELPVDPINSPPYYYAYSTGRSYEISAYLEFDGSKRIDGLAGKDSGTSWNVFESGSNLKLIPMAVEDGMGRDKNLRAYWPFDEATGTVIYDAGLNKMNGTIYGGAPWQTGQIRSGLRLDNRNLPNDYVQISHNSNLNFANRMSISVWLKPINRNAADASQTIINKEGSYELLLDGSSSPRPWWALMGTSPHDWTVNLATTTLSRNNWHNVVFVYNGQNVKIYTAAVLKYIINETGNIIDQQRRNLRIGFRYDDPTAYFNGVIDEVRMYDKELSGAEIQMLYEAAQ